MSMGIQSNYRPQIEAQIETRNAKLDQIQKQSYLDQVDRYGGIKLEKSQPQPRADGEVPPPELKNIRERAPFTSQGKEIDGRRFAPDPKSALGQFLGTIKGHDENVQQRCMGALEDIRDGYTIMKSPPDHDYAGYVTELRNHAEQLRARANDSFGQGMGMDVSLAGGEFGDTTVGEHMTKMLEHAAKELEDLAAYLEDRPDPRPTMEDVGHFKSLETQAAIDLVDKYIGEKTAQLNNAPENSPERQALLGDIENLVQTKGELQQRRDTFKGLDPDHAEWTGKEPLDSRALGEVAGAKPSGLFQKFLKKIGLGAWANAEKDMKKLVRSEEGGRMPPLTSNKIGEGKMLSMFLTERLKSANCASETGKALSSEDVKHGLERCHSDVMGKQQEWNKIEKDVTLTINGESKTFKSTLTPQSQLEGARDLEKGKGVCCHDAWNSNPANLWQSELKDDQGTVLFRQIRTGVNCAYNIEDETDRKAANLSRATQVMKEHINNDPRVQSQIQEYIAKKKAGENPEPIVMRNLWISHLTPDHIRPKIAKQNENEQLMSIEQNEAMKQSVHTFGQDKPLQLLERGPDGNLEEVEIKYEPIMFSIGVNTGAVTKSMNMINGWDIANERFNDPSMKALLGDTGAEGGAIGGWVGEALQGNRDKIDSARRELDQLTFDDGFEDGVNPETEKRRTELQQTIRNAEASNERIEGLSKQVQDLWMSGDYMKQGNDPYKMSSRLGVLGFEIGSLITSNCKSNKDRNSFADAHMKDLAIQMHTKGELRAPDQPLSQEEKFNLRSLTLGSGNSELQHLNVGGAGYKLSGVSSVFESLGLAKNDISFMGVGPYTAT